MNIKTNLTALTLLMLVFSGCKPKEKKDENPSEEPTTPSVMSTSLPTGDNSKNALDWPGTYQGTLPCADCEGIKTQITLLGDGTFTRSLEYLGREDGKTHEQGTFSWDETGSTITLTSEDGQTQMYFVGENVLFHLDQEGNRITGNLADRYRLQKNFADYALEGKKWILVELMGKEIENLQKPVHITFDAITATAYGNNGCNNFRGAYELKPAGRLRLGNLAQTMMACPDMEVPAQVDQVLQRMDNYTVSEGVLSLNKARMAPLAKFEEASEEGE